MSKSLRKVHANNWAETAYNALINENIGFFAPLLPTSVKPSWSEVLELRCPPGANTVEAQLGYQMYQLRDKTGAGNFKNHLMVVLSQMRPPLEKGEFVYAGRDVYKVGLHTELALYYDQTSRRIAAEAAAAKKQAEQDAHAERMSKAVCTFNLKFASSSPEPSKISVVINLTPKIEALQALQIICNKLCKTEGAQISSGYTWKPLSTKAMTLHIGACTILPTWPTARLAKAALKVLTDADLREMRNALYILIKG